MTFRLSTLLVPALALAFAACNGDDDTDDTGTDTDTTDGICSNISCTDGLNEGSVCTITGTFTEDCTLSPGPDWVLEGAVFVGEDTEADGGGTPVTLTIEPGVTVFGRVGQRSFLAVSRGSMLEAVGTADEPIILTSGAESREPGDWGGLIINGKGLHNQCTDPNDCNVESEGNAGFYGGNDNADDSGTLEYVAVTHAGDQVTDTDQLNGIAFQAVGSNTSVNYIQVHRNADDGVEFFGGAVNAKYFVLTGIHDDSIDWTSGWTGKLQHGVVQQWDDKADRGIEADNNEDDNSATPRSKPIISHVTLIGTKDAPEADDGMKLRRGTGANLHSMLVVNFSGDCIDVDDAETYSIAADGNGLTGDLIIENSLVADCAGDLYDEDDGTPWTVQDWYENLNSGNTAGTGVATDYVEAIAPLTGPNWASKGDATSGGAAPDDSFFDNGAHIGGVAPGSDWTSGWIVLDEN